MFTAKVYNVMVGSLGGAMEEVYLAKETIRKWNQQNAERTGKLFMLVDWVAKEEEIHHVDVVIGIVDNWIENTGFIESCVEKGKQVMPFFTNHQDPGNTKCSELLEVRDFHNKMLDCCICAEFTNASELGLFLSERF